MKNNYEKAAKRMIEDYYLAKMRKIFPTLNDDSLKEILHHAISDLPPHNPIDPNWYPDLLA